ncbi:MAG: hypothetical protein J0L53_01625 [Spirochaetes bacterium]|nr:hypothetical protein [Spirochaetota bacterium]
MQCFESGAAFAFGFGLACDKGVVGRVCKKRRRMRVAGATVDAAVVDKEVAVGIFWENSVLRVVGDG